MITIFSIVTDVEYACDGKVIGVKPATAHPGDSHLFYVLVQRPDETRPFVTWLWNSQAQGLAHGHYLLTLESALRDFSQRGV